MAILDPNEILSTSFEPKRKNQFIMYIDGFPSYMIKAVNDIGYDSGEIKLNHINTYRKVQGRRVWNDINLVLFDPITPSGAQATMEWARLHHETVTGRSGYSDFYKKDITLNALGPIGDIVSEVIIKGSFIKNCSLGDWNWDTDAEAQEITMTLGNDGVILNF